MYGLTDAGRENLAACADDVRCLIGQLTDVLAQIDSVQAADGSGRRRDILRR